MGKHVANVGIMIEVFGEKSVRALGSSRTVVINVFDRYQAVKFLSIISPMLSSCR